MTKDELASYKRIQAVTKEKKPLKFLWYVLELRQISDNEYRVPSFTDDKSSHYASLDPDRCDCLARKSCVHIRVVKFWTRMRYAPEDVLI